MKLLSFLSFSFFFSFFVSGQSIIQNVLASSGDVLVSAEGPSLEYTLGEVMVATHVEGQYVLTEGFHQLFDEGIINGTHEQNIAENLFSLGQNYPNPFNNQTLIEFYLPKNAEAELFVYNNLGQLIFLSKESYGKGQHQIQLNADLFPTSGQYYYRLTSGNDGATKKMKVVR